MATVRSCLLAALLLSLLATTGATTVAAAAAASANVNPNANPASKAAKDTVQPFAMSPLHSKPPLEWSVKDVEYWMNYTIGYAEYSSYVRTHLIDGVTLLEMEPADFESYFPIENALHVVKIAAHVKLLKGLCRCTNASEGEGAAGSDGTMDFWVYMRHCSVRTWFWGSTALFFPRWAMGGVYLFDREVYQSVVGSRSSGNALHAMKLSLAEEGRQSAAAGAADPKTITGAVSGAENRVRRAAYWIAFVLAPDLYMAYRAALLTPRNPFLMTCIVAHFLAQAFSEAALLITIYRGTAFKPEMPLWERIQAVFSYTLFAPVLGLVAGYVFPVFLQYITVGILVAHSALMIFGLVCLLVKDGLGAATTGPEYPNAPASSDAAVGGANGDSKGDGSGGQDTDGGNDDGKRADGANGGNCGRDKSGSKSDDID